jgi:hypothetical protein
MSKKVLGLIVIALIAGVTIGLFFRFFQPFALPISSDKVNVYLAKGGTLGPNNAWLGTYWVITTTVDTDTSYYFYFNKDETRADHNDTDGKYEVIPKANIQFTFKPERPFYQIPLTHIPAIKVTDTVYKASSDVVVYYGGPEHTVEYDTYYVRPDLSYKIDPFTIEAYLQSGDYIPILHTPFTITIQYSSSSTSWTKDIYVDVMSNGTTHLLIDEGNNKVITLKGIGQLSQGWGEPHITPFIYFDKTNVFDLNLPAKGPRESIPIYPSALQCDYCAYSFSKYWFGEYGDINNYYWQYDSSSQYYQANGTPKPKHESNLYFKSPLEEVHQGQMYPINWVDYNGYYYNTRGWSYTKCYLCKGYAHQVIPVKPTFDNVMNYLRSEGAIPKDLTFGYKNVDYEVKGDKLYIYYPFGSSSALVQLYVSTEIADSYAVALGQGKFSITQYYWKSTGTDTNTQLIKDTLCVKVYNSGEKGEAEVRLKFVPESYGQLFQYEPYLRSVIPSNSSYTFEFGITSLGITQDIRGQIIASLYDTLLGYFYGNATFNFKAIATTTKLIIWTEGTNLPKEPAIYVNNVIRERGVGGYVELSLSPGDYIISFEPLNGYEITVYDESTATTKKLGSPPQKISLVAGDLKRIKGVYTFTSETTLTVILLEKGTTNVIPNVNVIVKYGGIEKSNKTSSSGTCLFNLGSYSGTVEITADTGILSMYNSNTTKVHVYSGTNSVTIYLESRFLFYCIIGGATISVLAIIVYAVKRRRAEVIY